MATWNPLELTEDVGVLGANARGLKYGHTEGELLADLQVLARLLGLLVILRSRVGVNAATRVCILKFYKNDVLINEKLLNQIFC